NRPRNWRPALPFGCVCRIDARLSCRQVCCEQGQAGPGSAVLGQESEATPQRYPRARRHSVNGCIPTHQRVLYSQSVLEIAKYCSLEELPAMSTTSRREFVRMSLTAGVTVVALRTPDTLFADPFGLLVGLQLYSLREFLPKDFAGTLQKIAAAGYQVVEA